MLSLAPTPPANNFVPADDLVLDQPAFPLDVFFCETCHHVQLLDVVDPAYLFERYVYVSGTSASFVAHFQKYAQECQGRFNISDGALVVDIGSNDGILLRFFNNQTVLGIDPAVDIAKSATEQGIETWPVYFDRSLAEKIVAQKGRAALVTANNMFAHADDLAGITDGIHHLLQPDGVFVFEVSYLLDVYQETLFDTIYHEHLAYHSVTPLKRFFSKHGMDLFAVQRTSSHGGSLRGMAQLAGGPHASDGSVEQLIRLEEEAGLDKSNTLKGYGAQIDKLKDELGALLARLRTEGKRVVGFGAPAKATTLMHHFDIGPETIEFIVDDSPLKQGLFTPGLHVPVVSADHLYAEQPDYVLILAWNFADPIMKNHQKFREFGGRFIVPLPTLEVI